MQVSSSGCSWGRAQRCWSRHCMTVFLWQCCDEALDDRSKVVRQDASILWMSECWSFTRKVLLETRFLEHVTPAGF